MIDRAFLALAHAPVELVRERIDRRVHVVCDRIGIDRDAAHRNGRFRLVTQLFDGQDAVQVDRSVETLHDAAEFLRGIGVQGRGDFDVVTAQVHSHRRLLLSFDVVIVPTGYMEPSSRPPVFLPAA